MSNSVKPHYNIAVKVDVNEHYQTPEKITYNVIQDYIRETYDFWARSSYISEVKRECGLTVCQSHRTVKNPARVYRCTEKRKKQIKEALRHFGII